MTGLELIGGAVLCVLLILALDVYATLRTWR